MNSVSELSFEGVRTLFEASSEDESLVLQVIDFEKKKHRYYVTLSDGNYFIKVMPQNQELLDPQNDLNMLIEINSHILVEGKKKMIGLVNYKPLFMLKSKIGNPVQYTSEAINPENLSSWKLDSSLIIDTRPKSKIDQDNATSSKKPSIEAQKPTQKDTGSPFPSSLIPSRPLDGSLKDYEIIKNLFIGMPRWTIICRLVKLDYKQFISKNTNKETKVLNVQLMDRTGMKVSGTFFGDAAVQFKDVLIKDRVYKISKGQIKEENYNNSKNQKLASIKLVFNKLAEFQQVSDTNSIAKNEDAATTLAQVVEKNIIGQEFDVLCILVKVLEPVTLKKEDRDLKKTQLLVADPIRKILMKATVWNDDLVPGKQVQGKAIILSRFIMSEYKGSLSLTSVYRSTIIPVEQHSYKHYEEKVQNQYETYDKLYQLAERDERSYEVCQTIKQLQNALERLGEDQWARADLDVYINRFSIKKYHYAGCPHCGKAAESLNNCTNCQKYVEKTIQHFILPIQLSDCTGSIWTTAYDQWAKKIFDIEDQVPLIEHFLSLNPDQLKQVTENYLYQEYRLRINSKKDKEGKVKHHMSKLTPRNEAQETKRNIQLISKMIIQ